MLWYNQLLSLALKEDELKKFDFVFFIDLGVFLGATYSQTSSEFLSWFLVFYNDEFNLDLKYIDHEFQLEISYQFFLPLYGAKKYET